MDSCRLGHWRLKLPWSEYLDPSANVMVSSFHFIALTLIARAIEQGTKAEHLLNLDSLCDTS